MLTVFIDVDGTLISKDDAVRPHVDELIEGLTKLGTNITIWSAGGKDYAAGKWNMIANRIYRATGKQLHRLVKNFAWKADWGSKVIVGPHLYIDDQTSLIEAAKDAGYYAYWVPFYEPSDDDDKALLIALDYAEFLIND